MRFNPSLLDEIRARLPVSQVVGRKVALKKAGREWRGLSPFKVEKTPSFYVNDQKGFYHCFASGEHGDIFTFLMKTEGLDFPEAVERLAGEAGVPMPKRTERDAQDEDQRQRLYRLLEASARFFEDCLRSANGATARAYIERRGLKRETVQRFRLGFAPNSRTALSEHLVSQGFKPAEMAAAGMLISGEDIREPYDRFRGRVMFPITDLKGRVIAFGGRALEKDAQAKYLNSPETPLFHKGHVLFNAAAARAPAHDKSRIIVVEGYMDVVSLVEAGIPEAVAPLGTALTEDQIKLLWRIVQVPVLCFDGDGAGRKAAYRAVDTMLPHLAPGQSAAFAFLPDGLDPDDMVRREGTAAFEMAIERARPLIDVLWEREQSAHPLTTPEQRAALETRLKGLAATIGDPIVRSHYLQEIRDRLFRLSRPQAFGGPAGNRPSGGRLGLGYARPVQSQDWRARERQRLTGAPAYRRGGSSAFPPPPLTASPELSGLSQQIPPREALILKTLLNHPWLIDQDSEAISALEFQSAALTALRDEILSLHARTNSLDNETLRTQLTKTGVAKVVDLVARSITHMSDRFAEPEASATEVEAGWNHVLELHKRQVDLGRQLQAAEEAWYQDCTQEAEDRLLEIKRQIEVVLATNLLPDEDVKDTGADASGGNGVRRAS